LLESCRLLRRKGYNLFATPGTQKFLLENGVESTVLYWPDDAKKPNTLDYIKEKKLDMVINIPKDLSVAELDNDYSIRRGAIDFNIPLLTNARLAVAFIDSFCNKNLEDISIKSWDEFKIHE